MIGRETRLGTTSWNIRRSDVTTTDHHSPALATVCGRFVLTAVLTGILTPLAEPPLAAAVPQTPHHRQRNLHRPRMLRWMFNWRLQVVGSDSLRLPSPANVVSAREVVDAFLPAASSLHSN